MSDTPCYRLFFLAPGRRWALPPVRGAGLLPGVGRVELGESPARAAAEENATPSLSLS
jgi:hypothetical protein